MKKAKWWYAVLVNIVVALAVFGLFMLVVMTVDTIIDKRERAEQVLFLKEYEKKSEDLEIKRINERIDKLKNIFDIYKVSEEQREKDLFEYLGIDYIAQEDCFEVGENKEECYYNGIWELEEKEFKVN